MVVVLRMKELCACFTGVIVAWVIVTSFVEVQVDAIKSVPGYFVLGDSGLDVGENNYVPNAFHANFPPYGETFFHRPTGRFTNGRNVGDFIAQALELPFAPPYLQPNATFNKGVNFASGGSGLFNTTSVGLAIPFNVQLEQYKNVTTLLVKELGAIAAKKLISESLFLIAIGSNDIVLGYLANPMAQKKYTTTQYINLMLDAYKSGIETLYASGVRKMVLLGVGVIGCSPDVRVVNNLQCLDLGNELAIGYNTGLKQLVNIFHATIPDLHLVVTHSYDLIYDMIQHPQSFGLKNVTTGCCGAGLLQAQFQCGTKVPTNVTGTHQKLCKHPSKYLYWDLTHNTQYVYKLLFQSYWGGNSSHVYPFNLRTLALL
jgi:phospholipase/lecithinase/hemolysin